MDESREPLSPDKFWPPLKKTEKMLTEKPELKPIPDQPERLKQRAEDIHTLLVSELDHWKDGFQRDLLIDDPFIRKDKQPPIESRYVLKGVVNVELSDTFENGVKIEVVSKDGRESVVVIDENGVFYTTEELLQVAPNLVDNLFVQEGETLCFNDEVIQTTVRNLSSFRDRFRRKKEEEKEGGELEGFESPEALRTAVDSLAQEIRTAFTEAPEITGIDREEIVSDAISAVAEFTDGKINPDSKILFDTLVKDRRIIFLTEEDYRTMQEAWGSEKLNQSTGMITYLKGVVVVNQDNLVNGAKTHTDRYRLVRCKSEEVEVPASPLEAVSLLAEYIPYRFGIEEKPLDKDVGEISGQDVEKELIISMLWSLSFHEGLHVATGNNHFPEGLDEAATHYYTAIATLQREGVNAFGAYLTFSGLDHAINWACFIRDFPIDEGTAEQMYYNKDDTWTIDKMFAFFPKDQEEGFLNILRTGAASVK